MRLDKEDSRRQVVTLLNPLGEEYSVMRTQLVSSMLTVLALNDSRKIPAVRMFEVGKLFLPKALPVTEQPAEIPAVCLGLYGPDEDFFTLKGIVETVFKTFLVLTVISRLLLNLTCTPAVRQKSGFPGYDAPVAVLGEVPPLLLPPISA